MEIYHRYKSENKWNSGRYLLSAGPSLSLYYVGQDERLAAPLIYEPFTNGQLGVLMPKGSEDLLSYVNEFLEEEKETGRIDELAEEYIWI
jgi:ABC-type amino acid transport substrate-binding protein